MVGRAYKNPNLNHPRVAAGRWADKGIYFLSLWHKPRTDHSGESIGPLVAVQDIQKIMLNQVEDYLQNALHVPPKQDYEEFNQTYQDIKERPLKRIEEKEADHRRKVDEMIQGLQELLDKPFRDSALKTTALPAGYSERSDRCVEFHDVLVKKVLLTYACDSSKLPMNKETMRDIADKINAKLRLIADNNFLDFRFLDEADPFEAILKEKTQGKYTDAGAILEDCSEPFFELLEKDKLLAALMCLYGGPYGNPRGSFIGHILLGEAGSQWEMLAMNTWQRCLREEYSEQDDTCFGRAFEASTTRLELAKDGWQAYYHWINEKYPHGHSRRDFAILHARSDYNAMPFLEREDFTGLDELQNSPYRLHLVAVVRRAVASRIPVWLPLDNGIPPSAIRPSEI